MMLRDDRDAVIAIPQPSHALISGQAMRLWGNADFGMATPNDDVCLAAELHDIGWLPWEQRPSLNDKTGLPYSFRELGVAVHTSIWSQGTALALSYGRYTALLVSLHGTHLYINFDFAAASPEDGQAVRAFLDEQSEIQRGLIEKISSEERYADAGAPEAIEKNRMLVRTADRLSIAICTQMHDVAVRCDDRHEARIRNVPTANGDVELCLRSLDDDFNRFTLDPWPFRTSTVSLRCSALRLPRRQYPDDDALQNGLRNATSFAINAELEPA